MTARVYRLFDRLAAAALPARCVLCHGPGQPPSLDLCAACEADLPWLAGACARCGEPSAEPCACAGLARPYARCHAAFDYAFSLDHLVQALKYEGALANARVLGHALAQSLRRAAREADVDAIVPIPLHRARLVERGFNQSLEIARTVRTALGLALLPAALERTRATAAQVGLARAARRDNVRGAFAGRRACVEGRRLALLDDVVTTGATVAEAAVALRAAGARHVDVWCLARASP